MIINLHTVKVLPDMQGKNIYTNTSDINVHKKHARTHTHTYI